MMKHLTAGLLSLGIAFAGVAAPSQARADQGDVALIVSSAIALFALKEILEDDSKKKKASSWNKKPNTSYSRRNAPQYNGPPYGKAHGHYKNGKRDRADYWRVNRLVPGQCFYRYSGRNGFQGVFGERCIAGVTGSARYLPENCRRSDGRQFSRAPAYDAACLRARGYRVEARRH